MIAVRIVHFLARVRCECSQEAHEEDNMAVGNLNEYVLREEVMKLLSAAELAEIEHAAAGLREGQEYLDLEQALQGVKRAAASSPPKGRFLPRDAVNAATWSKIVALVTSTSNEAT
jgi:hypothetical protein